MITRKLWNSFSKATRLDILNLCKVDSSYILELQESYHHDFNYNSAGKELLKVLNRCYKEASGQLKILSWITPTYEVEKPVREAKNNKDLIIRYGCSVPDFEHDGDIDYQISYIKSKCPQATNFKGWSERDYEAEADYKSDYGELDEPIYQGYVEFDAPMSCGNLLEDIDCYPIKLK